MTLSLPHDDVVPTDDEIAELGLAQATIAAFRRVQENHERLRGQWPLRPEDTVKAPQATVTNTAVQAIGHAAWTALTFDTVDQHNGTLWTVGAPTRLTAPRTGLYAVGGDMILNWAGGEAYLSVWAGGLRLSSSFSPISSAGSTPHLHTATHVRLTAGAYCEVMAYQGSGGSQNTYLDGTYRTRAYMTFLSP